MLSILNLLLLAALGYVWYAGADLRAGLFVLGALVVCVGWALWEKLDWVHSETLGVERHLAAVAPMPQLDPDERATMNLEKR